MKENKKKMVVEEPKINNPRNKNVLTTSVRKQAYMENTNCKS